MMINAVVCKKDYYLKDGSKILTGEILYIVKEEDYYIYLSEIHEPLTYEEFSMFFERI